MMRATIATPVRLHPRPRACAMGALAMLLVLVLAPASRAQFNFSDRTPGLKNETPEPIKGLELQPRLGERLPLDLPLTDPSGKPVKLGDYFNRPARDSGGQTIGTNKPVVLIMVYFKCKLQCPMVLEKFTASLKDVDFTAGREYDAIVVSFDHRDSPTDAASQRNAQVSIYGRSTSDEAREGWNFLVGKPEDTRRLGDALGFPYRFIPEAGEFAHPNSVFVLTPDGRISRQFTGLTYPAKDIRLALLEASEGKIGSLLDKFTFWCYHFDLTAGAYSLRWMRVMQLAAAATIVGLGSLIGLLLWRERRRHAPARSPLPARAPQLDSPRTGAVPETV